MVKETGFLDLKRMECWNWKAGVLCVYSFTESFHKSVLMASRNYPHCS